MKNHQIISLLEAQIIGMRRAKMLLTEFENSQIDHYQREHDMLLTRIFILKSKNELGVSEEGVEKDASVEMPLDSTHDVENWDAPDEDGMILFGFDNQS